MVKKLFIGLGVIFGLFVLVAIAVPLFFDANKYRPQIEKLVEENINADLELGQLKLSLWGGLNIAIEKMVLSEKGSQGKKPIVSFNDAKLEIPLSSVLSGRPDITLAVKNPNIQVVVEPDGKLNVSKIAKPAAPQTQATQKPTETKSGGGMNLPFELSFDIVDGVITYVDEKAGTKAEIRGINFELHHFALNKPFDFAFNSNLDVKGIKDLTLKGPAKITGTSGVYMGAAGFDHLDLQTDVDLSGFAVKYGALFNKAEKAPLKAAFKINTTSKNLKIDKGHFQVEDASVDLTGSVNNFESPQVNINIASSKFIFEHWQEVLGPLKEFDMKGAANFDLKIVGPTSKLAFQGKAQVQDMSLKAPGIVPRVTDVKATLAFNNDSAAVSNAGLKMGASDLAIDGTVHNFTKPVIVFNVKSQVLDVDALLPQKTPEQQKADAEQVKGQGGSTEAAFDAEKMASGPIAAMKKNPIARALDFTANAKIGRVRVHKADVTNVAAELTFKDLVMTLKKATANTFSSTASFNSSIDFRGADPVYSAVGEVTGLDMNAAVSNQMPPAKDSIFGKAQAHFQINGAGLSKAKVTQSLKGKGDFRIDNGSWSALAALKMIGEKLKSLPAGLGEKLGTINITDKFRQMKGEFNIASGKINLTNVIADMEGANTGVTGLGWVDFDMNQDLHLTALLPIPRGNLDDMRGSDGRVKLPLEITGTVMSPSLQWQDAGKLVGTSIAKQQVKQVGGDAIKKALGNVDNPAVKDLLKKLPF